MSEMSNTLSFSTIIASSVHDMKNSLSILMSELEGLIDDHRVESDKFSFLHDQAYRINTDLIKLLSLYKLEQQLYTLQCLPCCVVEFVEEQIMQLECQARVKGIQLICEGDENLTWNFDATLIASVINDVLSNALRYTHNQIHIKVETDEQGLHIIITDNGPGYPEELLVANSSPAKLNLSETNSTGLGLYFTEQVAKAHQHAGKTGQIKLRNRPQGGGEFELILP